MTADVDKSKKKEARGASAPGKRATAGNGNELGKALRTIYDEAVSEQVPPEMLELLGKLQ